MQVSCILVVSHLFNVVFRTVGQPGIIAQILVINHLLIMLILLMVNDDVFSFVSKLFALN